MKSCPCCSQKTYRECCQPFHDGQRLPETALQLMRSRYAAYALNLPDYIIQTTHPAHPQYCHDHSAWREKISAFALHSQFKKLEILDFTEQGNSATVTFIAHLIQDQQLVLLAEKSSFEKVEGRWLYRMKLPEN